MTPSSLSPLYWRWPRHLPLWGVILGATLTAGCADVPEIVLRQDADTEMAVLSDAAPAQSSPVPPANGDFPGHDIGQLTPQLVKRASLELLLTDIDDAVEQVQATMQAAQGNLLTLQDQRSAAGVAQQVSITLRVPQAELDATLQRLRSLGTVQQQSITAEDVSSQQVDLEARLKNLRQAETALLEIMARSGEIAHVLEVARELNSVRESIERLAAQQQNLERQVAFAQIQLFLASPVPAMSPLRPVHETLDSTWQMATQSVQAFTVTGLKIALWILAYSPYWLLLLAMGYGGYRLWQRRPPQTLAPETDH
ncbi:DUF4349 domain-containing protein [Nodosilinea sp. P-1105]|uniref:DUF4349 domain-containing protein n=1 Tax=Nodosilinea sp. P-1105 TaxID=2546229 RepID=UPI00146B4840|nr:DUF4349 domain-containing protein [Nodosilinea sp. P-1105]